MTRDGRDLIVFLLLTVLLMGGIIDLETGSGHAACSRCNNDRNTQTAS